MQKHVAVLMGGWSAEREVSLRSGEACISALKDIGFQITAVDIQPDVSRVLEKLRPDVALNVLHGCPGEDGTIQGILEILRIPYTHSGVLASALAMHKPRSKIVLAAAGIPVADGRSISRAEAAKEHAMSRPYVIKPAAEGSSVGVYVVTEEHAHPPQELSRSDWSHGETLMVEEYVPGIELTCAVFKERASEVVEIEPSARFYDYESKYADGGSKHVIPARIEPEIYRLVQQRALVAHRALGCRGVSRVDFRYRADPGGPENLICLEVNTQPGMTTTSLVPEAAAYAGCPFRELVGWMIEDASLNR